MATNTGQPHSGPKPEKTRNSSAAKDKPGAGAALAKHSTDAESAKPKKTKAAE